MKTTSPLRYYHIFQRNPEQKQLTGELQRSSLLAHSRKQTKTGLAVISLNSDHKSQLYLKGDVGRSITRTKILNIILEQRKYYMFCILSPGYCTYFSIPFL